MSKAYDEIMDRIVVNDDMRRRVLQNVEKRMVDGAGTGENQAKKAGMKRQPAEKDAKPANNVELQGDSAVWGEEKRLRRMRRYRISKFLSAVACLALLITGVVVLPQINRGQQEPTSDQEMVGGANGMESVASADELFQKLGFPVSDLKNLPFTVEHTEYTNGWGKFALIDYEGVDADGNAQSLCYRKGIGEEDISGDYNVYEVEETADVSGVQVTLKGSADGYVLAVWNADGYAYAVSVTKKITKEEMLQIVEEIVKK